MTHHTRRLRRYAAAALIPFLMLLSACGVQYDFVINDNDTIDATGIVWGEHVSESDCKDYQDELNSAASGAKATTEFTEYKGQPACRFTTRGVPLKDASKSGSNITVTHDGDLYKVDIKVEDTADQATTYGGDKVEVIMSFTFPGDVTEATGKTVKTDGNKVTWSNLVDEKGTLHAEANDSPGLPWLWIGVGAVVVLLVVGGVVGLLILRKRSAKSPGYTSQDPTAPGVPGQVPLGGYDPSQPFSPNQPYPPAGQPSGYRAVPEGAGPAGAQPGPYQQPGQPSPFQQGAQPSPYQQPGQPSPFQQGTQPSPYQQPGQAAPFQQPGQAAPFQQGAQQPNPYQQPGQAAPFQQANPYQPSQPSAPSAPGQPSAPSAPASGNPADSMPTQALPQGQQPYYQPSQPSAASGNPADSLPTQALPQGQQPYYQPSQSAASSASASAPSAAVSGNPADSMPTQALPQGQQPGQYGQAPLQPGQQNVQHGQQPPTSAS